MLYRPQSSCSDSIMMVIKSIQGAIVKIVKNDTLTDQRTRRGETVAPAWYFIRSGSINRLFYPSVILSSWECKCRNIFHDNNDMSFFRWNRSAKIKRIDSKSRERERPRWMTSSPIWMDDFHSHKWLLHSFALAWSRNLLTSFPVPPRLLSICLGLF